MRKILLLVTVLAISGCKAEKIEISLDPNIIIAAAGGRSSEVVFEATVGERFTSVDDEKRALIKSVKGLIEKFFPAAEVDVDIGADEYEIDVKGNLIVSKDRPSSGAPWYVSATQAVEGDGFIVQLVPSASFEPFEAELQEVNIMLGPDEFQPVEFEFTASSGIVIVGGAIVDGMPTGVARIPMAGQTIKMLFKDGVWEQTSGSFLYLP